MITHGAFAISSLRRDLARVLFDAYYRPRRKYERRVKYQAERDKAFAERGDSGRKGIVEPTDAMCEAAEAASKQVPRATVSLKEWWRFVLRAALVTGGLHDAIGRVTDPSSHNGRSEPTL